MSRDHVWDETIGTWRFPRNAFERANVPIGQWVYPHEPPSEEEIARERRYNEFMASEAAFFLAMSQAFQPPPDEALLPFIAGLRDAAKEANVIWRYHLTLVDGLDPLLNVGFQFFHNPAQVIGHTYKLRAVEMYAATPKEFLVDDWIRQARDTPPHPAAGRDARRVAEELHHAGGLLSPRG